MTRLRPWSANFAPEEPTPSFHVQTDLVTVPFRVRRGFRSISDLNPSDVVLLEDGIQRSFTVFEAPPVHLTLDLVVMFDVTNPRITPLKADQKGIAGFWDASPSVILPTTGVKRSHGGFLRTRGFHPVFDLSL